jgi:hypothetical protein
MLRISGWVLPSGEYLQCKPWEHIAFAKCIPWLVEQHASHKKLSELWNEPDTEKLREVLAELGLVKVCYHLIDANFLNMRQLVCLQEIYGVLAPTEDIEFVGRIRVKLPVRIFLKMRCPDRLNSLC